MDVLLQGMEGAMGVQSAGALAGKVLPGSFHKEFKRRN